MIWKTSYQEYSLKERDKYMQHKHKTLKSIQNLY